MRPKSRAAFLVLNFAIVLVSCSIPAQSTTMLQSTPTLPTPKPTLSQGWVIRWLNGVVCHPPCWEGITPGVTTAEEAIEILNRNPLTQNATMTATTLLPELGYVEWEWAGGQDGGWANYNAQVSPHTIYVVYPFLEEELKLGDVIQAFGEPSHVAASDSCGPDVGSGRFYGLKIVYRPRGFYLLVWAGHSKPTIDSNLVIERVYFFDPNDEKDSELSPDLRPWQGFYDFYFYSGTTEGSVVCP